MRDESFEFPDPEVTKARHLMSYGVAEFRQDGKRRLRCLC